MGGGNFYDYCKENAYVAEELIVQHEELSAIYSKSVNTIRLFTLRGKAIGAVLRMGRGGSQIDNASSGGIYAEVGIESGRIVTPAFSYKNDTYLEHPDTHVFFQGYHLPYWEKCVELAEYGSKRVLGVPLLGWDIALTPEGPIVVEVNAQPEIPLLQIPRKKGLKNMILKNY